MNPAPPLIAALTLAAGLAHAVDYTVPGPSGESLKFYLESPLSPLAAGDTLILTDAGSYQTTYTVSDANLTIRAAAGQTIVIDGQFSGTVFTLAANNITFEGLTIQGGLASNASVQAADGGAINSLGYDLTVRNCRFEGNLAPDDGGAIAITDATLLVEGCAFVGNGTLNATADSYGGAILNVRGDITLRDSVFDGNDAPDGGGAIYIADTDARYLIERCVFSNNTAALGGAIIWAGGAEGDVFDTVFDGNESTGNAGAVYHNQAPATYTRCTFVNNRALGDDGGAVFINGETTNEVVLTSCLLANNSAASSGAALFLRIGPDPIILNCTIVDNNAGFNGGGAASEGSGATGFFRNCIVRGNTPDQFAGAASVVNSNVEGGFAGTNVIDADAMFVDALAGDYRLLDGSPSIDAGDTGFFSSQSSPTDLDGAPRAVTASDTPSGLSVLGLFVDHGAYEFQPATLASCPADANGDGSLNVDDIDAFSQSFLSGCN